MKLKVYNNKIYIIQAMTSLFMSYKFKDFLDQRSWKCKDIAEMKVNTNENFEVSHMQKNHKKLEKWMAWV